MNRGRRGEMPGRSLRALIFDLDGTIADTEEVHRRAFNQAFAEHGLSWTWSPAEYAGLLSNLRRPREDLTICAAVGTASVSWSTTHRAGPQAPQRQIGALCAHAG